jgi:Fe-S cluster assembly protein SufD
MNAALQSYVEPFQRAVARLPAARRQVREARLSEFLRLGFPTRKLEDWRYTDLSALAERTFEPARPAAVALEDALLPRSDRLVYVNGELDRRLSTADELSGLVESEGSQESPRCTGIEALNAAFAGPSLNLALGAAAHLARPLHLILAGAPNERPAMTHQRHRLELGEGAQAVVLVEFRGLPGSERLVTQAFEIRLAPGSRLTLYRLQDEAAGSHLITRMDAHLARDAHIEIVCLDRGHGLARHDLNIELAAPGAQAELAGFYQPGAGAHLDNHTRIVHAAPHGRSRECFKGIVAEKSRAVFNGKIVVCPGAQKTDSEQRVANLLLARGAELNAKPELEIYADDVKCAHGATVGQLDETALAYLRSRGIAEVEARALLLRAFALDILARIAWPVLRARSAALLGYPPLAEEALVP